MARQLNLATAEQHRFAERTSGRAGRRAASGLSVAFMGSQEKRNDPAAAKKAKPTFFFLSQLATPNHLHVSCTARADMQLM